MHWATDVIGGWVTGLAWLMLCLTVRQVWRQRRGRPAELLDTDADDDTVIDTDGDADGVAGAHTEPATDSGRPS